MDFRPKIILIDDPLSHDDLRSVTRMAEFDEWMSQLPSPAFFADQRAAKGGLPAKPLDPTEPPKIGFNALRIRDIGSLTLELEVPIPAAELPALCREHGRVFILSEITRRKDNGSTVLTFSPGNGVEELGPNV